MKIRNGFVSNSSSSSFLVQVGLTGWDKLKQDDDTPVENPMIAREESIPLLEEYGFTETSSNTPLSFKSRPDDEEDKPFMRYSVSCNEDDVLAFLMKNNIPFKASCHYDHYYILFTKDSESYLYAKNFGNEIDMYGFGDEKWDWECVCRTPKIEERLVKQFIEDNR